MSYEQTKVNVELDKTQWADWNQEQKNQYIEMLSKNLDDLQYEKVVADDKEVEAYLNAVQALDKNDFLMQKVDEQMHIMSQDEVNDYVKQKIDEAVNDKQNVTYVINCMGLNDLTHFADPELEPSYLKLDEDGHFKNITQGDLKMAYEEVLDANNLSELKYEQDNQLMKTC